jgi:hypothetical protein
MVRLMPIDCHNPLLLSPVSLRPYENLPVEFYVKDNTG